MGPNAVIITSGSVSFFAYRTVFAGCDAPWSKIQISKQGKFRFWECLLRDANGAGIKLESGYKPQPGYTNWIRNCYFVNNNIGISCTGTPGASITISPISFYGNQFLQSAGGNNGVGSIPMNYGIYMSYCNGILGNTGAVNLFDHKNGVGIIVLNSNMGIANCKFANFRLGGAFPVEANNTGIYAERSYLSVSTDHGNKCVFTGNAKSGIRSRYASQLIVKGAEFYDEIGKNQPFGILCEKNVLAAEINIEDNLIDYIVQDEVTAIKVERTPAADASSPSNTIRNNRINLPGGNGAQFGIFVEAFQDVNNKMYIDQNILHLAKQKRCINTNGIFVKCWAAVGKGFKITDNEVYYDFTGDLISTEDYTGSGIALLNAHSMESSIESEFINEVNDNLVTAANFEDFEISPLKFVHNPVSLMANGIQINDCHPFPRVFHNEVTNGFRNFDMRFDNTNCDFSCNIINYGRFGLANHAGSEAAIEMGVQFQKSNLWKATEYHRLGAAAWVNGTPGTIANNVTSKFFANPSITYHWPPTYKPADWFTEDTEPFIVCGGNFQDPPPDNTPRRFLSNLHTDMLYGSIPVGLTASQLWDYRRELSATLLNMPVITQTFPEAVNWLANNSITSSGKFAAVEYAVHQAVNTGNVIEATLVGQQTKAKQRLESIRTISDLIDAGSPDSLVLGQQLQIDADSLEHINSFIDALSDSILTTRRSALTGILNSQVPGLPNTSLYENVRKKYICAAIKLLMDDTLSQSEISQMYDIVGSCILDYGQTVDDAISMLPYDTACSLYGREIPPYEACSSGDRDNGNNATKLFTNRTVKLSPSPAHSDIFLSINESDTFISAWRIHNIIGNIIKEGTGSSPVMTIPVLDMPVGQYIISGNLNSVRRYSPTGP
jgi:hypothetical protein